MNYPKNTLKSNTMIIYLPCINTLTSVQPHSQANT